MATQTAGNAGYAGSGVNPIGQGMGDQNALQILMAAIGGDSGEKKKASASAAPTPAPAQAPAPAPAASASAPASSSAMAATPTMPGQDTALLFKRVLEMGTAHQMSQLMANGVTAQDLAPKAAEQAKAISAMINAPSASAQQVMPGQPAAPEMPGQAAAAGTDAPYYRKVPASSPFGLGGAKLDAEGNVVEQKAGVAAQVLSALLGVPIDASAQKDLAKLEKVQKLAGREPLQQGEKEKLGIEYAKSIAVKELELAAKKAEEGNLKPEHIFSKFEAASVPFITARDAHARLIEASKDPSGAGDLAMIFNFMKVLDPGSTVRESEAASVENARGVPESIRNTYNKVMKGQKLSDSQRADFLKRSSMLFSGMEKQQKKTTEEFSQLAKANGIDFSKVVRDTGLAAEVASNDRGAVKEGATATNPKTGQKLTYRGGKWQ